MSRRALITGGNVFIGHTRLPSLWLRAIPVVGTVRRGEEPAPGEGLCAEQACQEVDIKMSPD